MTLEERLDWLYRLRSEIVYMPYEWLDPMDEALTDAIKALKQEQKALDPKRDILNRLEERVEIEKLGCPTGSGYYRGINKALKIIQKYKAEAEQIAPKTEWIPVSERMPEDGSWGIWTNGKWVSVERYKVDIEDHFWPSGKHFELEDATAWMPLPPLYKAKEVEDGK